MLDDLTVGMMLHTEGVVKDSGDVIIPGVVQRKLRVRCWARGRRGGVWETAQEQEEQNDKIEEEEKKRVDGTREGRRRKK